jgi:sarcosine oxidase subunit gamma
MMTPRAPFAGLEMAHSIGGGITLRERDGLGIATILARKGKVTALIERLQALHGLALPQGPRRVRVAGLSLAGTGPGAWLATHGTAGNSFAASLTETIGDLASVSDQSDGYAVLRLSGPRVREALCKLVPIDLHSRVFGVGDVAGTIAGHVNVTLWRLEDGTDASPVFEIALYRSYAGSFWQLLGEAAGEFGLVRSPG